MRICLDFDGVLHDPTNREQGYKMGVPVEHALDAVKVLISAGHDLVIHSSRVQKPDDLDHIYAWLRFFGFPSIFVSTPKPLADLYIDDRGLRFTTWHEAMADERLSGSSH